MESDEDYTPADEAREDGFIVGNESYIEDTQVALNAGTAQHVSRSELPSQTYLRHSDVLTLI